MADEVKKKPKIKGRSLRTPKEKNGNRGWDTTKKNAEKRSAARSAKNKAYKKLKKLSKEGF